jgi:hypothetical protein
LAPKLQASPQSQNPRPYVAPVVIDYGDVVTITQAARGGRRDGGRGDDGADDLAGTT